MRFWHGVDFSRFYSVLSLSLLAFSFSIGGLLAGIFLIITFQSINNLVILILFPAILTIKGDINGILSGRLGTALHTGRILPSLRKNNDEFYILIRSIFVLTFIEMLAAGIIAFVMSLISNKVTFLDLPLFIFIPSLTGCIAIILSIPLTALISFLTFKKGLDPDIIVYPVISTINDILITMIYFGISFIIMKKGLSNIIGSIIFSILFLIVLILVFQNRKMKTFNHLIKEGGPVVLFCAILGVFGGLILSKANMVIKQISGILIIYPAIISNLGAAGSIIGSITSSNLHLGKIHPKISSLKNTLLDIFAIETASFFMHVIYGIIAYFIVKSVLSSVLKGLVITSILSNLLSFMPIYILSFLIALLTFRRGLDPDNFVIPLETSISDMFATFSLYISITLVSFFIL